MTDPTHESLERPTKSIRRATSRVLEEIRWERYRQEQLWGEQNHPDGTGPLLVLEDFPQWQDSVAGAMHIESWARRRCDSEHEAGRGTYEQILTEEWAEVIASSDPVKLRAELVQLAAVAAGWVSKIDRDLAAAKEPLLCPECQNGKTVNCVGVALDFTTDDFAVCANADNPTTV